LLITIHHYSADIDHLAPHKLFALKNACTEMCLQYSHQKFVQERVHNEIHTTRKPSKALPSGVSNQRAKGWQRANFVIRTVHKGHIRSPEGAVHLGGGLARTTGALPIIQRPHSEITYLIGIINLIICTTDTLPIHNSWNDITDDLFGRKEK